MSIKSYPIELPDSAFSAWRKTPAKFIQEMKYAAVVKWYKVGIMLNENWPKTSPRRGSGDPL